MNSWNFSLNNKGKDKNYCVWNAANENAAHPNSLEPSLARTENGIRRGDVALAGSAHRNATGLNRNGGRLRQSRCSRGQMGGPVLSCRCYHTDPARKSAAYGASFGCRSSLDSLPERRQRCKHRNRLVTDENALSYLAFEENSWNKNVQK